MNTPIYDELHAQFSAEPACPVCGDYALKQDRLDRMIQHAIDQAVDQGAQLLDLMVPGTGEVFRQLGRGIRPPSILGGPR